MDLGTLGELLPRHVPEELLDGLQDGGGLDVADDDEDRVVGSVPGVVKVLEHRAGRTIERGPGAEGVVGVGRSREHRLQEPGVEDVLRIGEVLGHFLLDGPAFLIPQPFGIEHSSHPDGLDVEGHVDVPGRHGEEVLGQALPGVGVEVSSHRSRDVGELGGRKPGTPAKHHVLLGVGHARKPGRSLVGAHPVVHDQACDRREGIADDDHLQAVVEGGAEDGL